MIIDPNSADALVKVLNSEAGKELTTSAFHEFGVLIGELANVVRFYGTENLKKIFTKWARNRYPSEVIQATEFKRIMPLLSAASMVSDDELQERWAALLETAAAGASGYLPSFGHTLSLITMAEARFLGTFWECVTESGFPHSSSNMSTPYDLFSYADLLSVLDRELPAEVLASIEHPRDLSEDLRMQLNQNEEELFDILGDLRRLGLFEAQLPINGVPKGLHSLTPYGVRFLAAVTPRRTS